METVKDKWQEYCEQVILKDKAEEVNRVQISNAKKAFLAGSLSTLDLVRDRSMGIDGMPRVVDSFESDVKELMEEIRLEN